MWRQFHMWLQLTSLTEDFSQVEGASSPYFAKYLLYQNPLLELAPSAFQRFQYSGDSTNSTHTWTSMQVCTAAVTVPAALFGNDVTYQLLLVTMISLSSLMYLPET